MYPSYKKTVAQRKTTVKDFLTNLGEEYIYAFRRGALGVVVEGKHVLSETTMKPGDKVVVFPIIIGG